MHLAPSLLSLISSLNRKELLTVVLVFANSKKNQQEKNQRVEILKPYLLLTVRIFSYFS